MLSFFLVAAPFAVAHNDTPDPKIIRVTIELRIESSGKVTASVVGQSSLNVVPSLPPVARIAPRASSAPAQPSGPIPAGYHRHKDSAGNVWQHHDSNFGKVGPHTSPWTGELVWPKYYGSAGARTYSTATPTVRYQSSSTRGLLRSSSFQSFQGPANLCPAGMP